MKMRKIQSGKLFCKVVRPIEKTVVKPVEFKDFVKYANFFYLTIGIQPYEDVERNTKRQILLANLIFYFEFVNLNIAVLTEIAFVVMAFLEGNNFIEATYAMSYVGFAIVSNCKMLFVWQQKIALTKIVNGLKRIFPEQKALQGDYNIEKHLSQCSFITLNFAILYMILIWTYNLMSIVKYMVCNILLGMKDVEQTLPFIVYLPWDWHHHWSYYIVYATQNLGGYTCAAGQISSDLFLIACTSQLIMHFDYLAQKITNFTGSACPQKDMEFLKASILYHTNLLDLCEQLNGVFGVPLLFNFISSAFVICFVGFQITIGASPETMIKLILFFVSSAAEVYLICHFGQQLLDVSTSVASAVYNQTWYWAEVRFQKMLILMAQRAQQPAQLKATKIVKVSLHTFSELMQISYKFFALLRTMFGN